MAQPIYHRLALVQLSFNPAYLDDSGVSYLHEPIFPGDEGHGLYRLAGLPEVNDLRVRVATSLIDHMSRKIKAVVEHAAREKVELLVLPEYSVPPELLEECKKLSREFGMVIVAGSHIATRPALAEHARLGMSNTVEEKRLGRAVCPVFLPSGQTYMFEKIHRSKWESSLIPGVATAPAPMALGQEQIQLQVSICIDAIQEEETSGKSRRGRGLPTVTVMPSLTPTTDLFYSRAQLLLASGKVTLFANIAEFGGSRVFARADRAKGWTVVPDGTEPVPRYSEALAIVEADLSNQFEVRKTTQEHFPVRVISVVPLIYADHSEACREFIKLVAALSSKPADDAELRENIQRFAAMDYRFFPRLMQEKLKHFFESVVNPGLADETAWRRWLTPVVVDTTPSTDAVRWNLTGDAIEVINELNLAGRYPEKTDVFSKTYGYLANKRNELRGRMEPAPSKSAAPVRVSPEEAAQPAATLGTFEPRFFDRESILSAI